MNIRGILGAGLQLSIVVIVFLVFCLGIALPWCWLAIIASALTALVAIMTLVLPETPRWLLLVNNQNEALENLKKTTWIRSRY